MIKVGLIAVLLFIWPPVTIVIAPTLIKRTRTLRLRLLSLIRARLNRCWSFLCAKCANVDEMRYA